MAGGDDYRFSTALGVSFRKLLSMSILENGNGIDVLKLLSKAKEPFSQPSHQSKCALE